MRADPVCMIQNVLGGCGLGRKNEMKKVKREVTNAVRVPLATNICSREDSNLLKDIAIPLNILPL